MDNWITNPAHPIHIAVDPLGLYESTEQSTPKPRPPQSGDAAELALWFVSIVLAASILVYALPRLLSRGKWDR